MCFIFMRFKSQTARFRFLLKKLFDMSKIFDFFIILKKHVEIFDFFHHNMKVIANLFYSIFLLKLQSNLYFSL